MGSSQSREEPKPEKVKLSPYEEAVILIEENKSDALYLNDMELDNLPPIPRTITSISLEGVKLKTLDNLPVNLESLYIESSKINYLNIDNIPLGLRKLDVSDSEIQEASGSFMEYKKLTNIRFIDSTGFEKLFKELPMNLQSLNCTNDELTSLPTLPKSLEKLYCNNNQLTSLPPLSKSLTTLNCRMNQLTSLPSLPKSLEILNCTDNQLTSLPPLPKSLTTLLCANNQLTSLPPLPKSLKSLNIYNNKIENIPNIKGVDKIMTCKNNIKDYDCIKKNFKSENIETYIFNEKKLMVLKLKKGTLLFRTMGNLNSINDIFVGIKNKNDYVLPSDHESYFFLHPFNNVYGDNTVIFVLTNDIDVILGVNPADDFNKKTINQDYGQNCNTKKHRSRLQRRIVNNINCLSDKLIEQYPNVLGWLAPDDNDSNSKHRETKHFPKYREYVSFYENSKGVLARPELAIYPLKTRSLEDVITPVKEFNAEWIEKHIEEFNYKPIVTIDYNVEFKEYKKVMDKLLSEKGFSGYKVRRDEEDGLYYLIE